MSIPHLGLLVRLSVPTALSVLLVGCGGEAEPLGPTTDQAGHSLQTQVGKMQFATGFMGEITDTLYEQKIPCGDGRFKLTYAVSGRATNFATSGSAFARSGNEVATPGDIIDDLVGFVPQVGTFTITERRSGEPTAKLVNTKTYTRLTLHSPGPNKLMISGETYCLRAGRRLH